jgi:hypothetical protein
VRHSARSITQRELERMSDAANAAIVICDRGTVDGAAYWSGPDDFWAGPGRRRIAR